MSASSSCDYGHGNCHLEADVSPSAESKISRSRSGASSVTSTQVENNVEELEMLLEVFSFSFWYRLLEEMEDIYLAVFIE